MRSLGHILAAVAVLVSAGCATENPGSAPPTDRLNFPVSLALQDPSATGGALYVVNSNFDLRYNRGTVMALDLSKVGGRAAVPVAELVDPERSVVFVDSFGGKQALFDDGAGGAKTLFVATRFDHRLYALRADGLSLSCRQPPDGTGPLDCLSEGLRLVESDKVRADDPFGLALVGKTLFVTHIRPTDDPEGTDRNRASYLVELDAANPVAPRFIAIGAPPSDASAWTPRGLYLTGRRTLVEANKYVERPLRAVVGNDVVDVGLDTAFHVRETRGIAVSSDGSRLFLATRFPDGLLSVDVGADLVSGAARNRPLGFAPLPGGANEVVVLPRAGRRDLVAVSCTSSGNVALYDDEVGEVVALVAGLRSPFGMVFGARPGGGRRLYVAGFGSDTIEVLDLADPDRPREIVHVGRLGIPANLPLGIELFSEASQ